MTSTASALHDPQTLYRRWEGSQWNPWDVALEGDQVIGVPLESLDD